MKLTIQYKLFLAMLIATAAVIAYMAMVIQWSFDKGFLEYVDTTEQDELKLLRAELESYYVEHKSWDGIASDPILILQLYAQTLPEGGKKASLIRRIEQRDVPRWVNGSDKDNKDKRPSHPMMRTILLDEHKQVVVGEQVGRKLPEHEPIMYQNREVGYLGRYSPEILSDSHQLLFVKKQKTVIVLVGIAALFIIIGLSLPLAYHFTKPVRRLSAAAKNLISGDYSTRVHVSAKDELGELSRDFNVLARTLADNELQRKQWVSDIAHELRTPLTSLQGEIEAVQDGIRKPDAQTFENLHQGVKRLNRLVEDLYDLARSDLEAPSFYPEKVDFLSLVSHEVDLKRREAESGGLGLELEFSGNPSMISGDRQRLQQLVGNLLGNSIAYTETGGTVNVALHFGKGKVTLNVSDSAPGVPDQVLELLFDRLFRVEQSRNRKLGGSGLGLAICRQIVAAHGGTIKAYHSPTGGLWIQVIFPTTGE